MLRDKSVRIRFLLFFSHLNININWFIYLYMYTCIYIYTYTNTTAGTQVASGLRRNRKKIMGWNQLETYQNGGQHVAMGRPDINHFVENQQRAIQSGPPLKAKLVLHIRLTMVYDEELHLYTYIHTYIQEIYTYIISNIYVYYIYIKLYTYKLLGS